MKEITLTLTTEQAGDIINALFNYKDADDELALMDIAEEIKEQFYGE
jgi:hypothetical protein